MTDLHISLSSNGCPSQVSHDRCLPEIDLLSPLTIRGVNLKSRIVVSPMCQYSAKEGLANDWHLVHLGSRAVGGAALVFVEATAVTAQGRISSGDLGIWNDHQIEPLARIAHFIHQMNAVAGIQLAHAGRKGSSMLPWEGRTGLWPENNGWPVIAPSAIPFSNQHQTPQTLDQTGIKEVIEAFKKAAQRALKAGFKIIEIHAAHGYLLHEFLSPLSNHRTDEYGGSLENRMRLVCEIAMQLRSIIPSSMPLFVRISATDWVEGGWDLKQSIKLAKALKLIGVDLIDVSSGGTIPDAKTPMEPNYQVPFAASIRQEGDVLTSAVGLITEAHQANAIITSGSADLVCLAREFLREPYWALKAEQALHQEPQWPLPYGYAIHRHS